jgi:hypothetical protein
VVALEHALGQLVADTFHEMDRGFASDVVQWEDCVRLLSADMEMELVNGKLMKDMKLGMWMDSGDMGTGWKGDLPVGGTKPTWNMKDMMHRMHWLIVHSKNPVNTLIGCSQEDVLGRSGQQVQQAEFDSFPLARSPQTFGEENKRFRLQIQVK